MVRVQNATVVVVVLISKNRVSGVKLVIEVVYMRNGFGNICLKSGSQIWRMCSECLCSSLAICVWSISLKSQKVLRFGTMQIGIGIPLKVLSLVPHTHTVDSNVMPSSSSFPTDKNLYFQSTKTISYANEHQRQ